MLAFRAFKQVRKPLPALPVYEQSRKVTLVSWCTGKSGSRSTPACGFVPLVLEKTVRSTSRLTTLIKEKPCR